MFTLRIIRQWLENLHVSLIVLMHGGHMLPERCRPPRLSSRWLVC